MPTSSISSACADGRAQNPRFIQRQLRRLHGALTQNAAALKEAIAHDGPFTANDAALEYALSLDEVRKQFSGIDVKSSLEDEYRTARGQDSARRIVPCGIVYVRPASHTLVYSIIAPLSSAIAAGNCVVVEIKHSLLRTTSLLHQLLERSLDQDTFAVVEAFSGTTLSRNSVIVDPSVSETPVGCSVLRSPTEDSRAIAFVDRSADIAVAAKEIVQICTAFRGRSPYAPDVVLVNEFAVNDFLQAAVQACTQLAGRSHVIRQEETRAIRPRRKARDSVLSEEERSDPDTTVVFEGDQGSIMLIGNRKMAVLKRKIPTQDIIIHPVSSLDDAIDLANVSSSPALASYHFAALPAAKYSSQFIHAHVSFINSIPVELRVGPPAPAEFPASANDRYRPEMFSTPSPQYVQPSSLSTLLQQESNARKGQQNASVALEQMTLIPLPRDDQGDGKVVGFFDQGLITGATILSSPIIVGLAVASYYSIRAGWRLWRPSR